MESQPIAIYHEKAIWLYPIADVVYLKADQQYTKIAIVNNGKVEYYTQSHNLKRFSGLLEHHFIQPRNNYIINLNYVCRLIITTRQVFLRVPLDYCIDVPRSKWVMVRNAITGQSIGPYK